MESSDFQLNLSIDPLKSLLPQLKDYIQESNVVLERHFKNNNKVRDVVIARSNHIDNLLVKLWGALELPYNCALLAVGGFGRGELHPFSDIDLLILLPQGCSESYSSTLSHFVTHLWDIGLIVGHSVRNIKECLSLANSDITIATNLMESRLLAGDKNLFDELRVKTSPDKMWNAKVFFEAKRQEQKQRYRKYDGSSFDLEPNLKSSPGGLRDIHLIGWIAQRQYYPKSLFELIQDELITKKEYFTLIKNQLFLWKIRFALHKVSAKAEDRLLFDHQKDVATYLGYSDDDESMSVEKLMKQYYRSVSVIRNISEILLQALEEKIYFQDLKVDILQAEHHYQLKNSRIDAIDKALFQKHPGELIRIFQVLSDTESAIGISAKTLRAIRASRNQINPTYSNNPKNRALFIAFWNNKNLNSRAIFGMKRSGVLSDYLPVFQKISGQMQYDMFHSYTVDEHTLFLIRNLTEFTNEESKDKFPLCHQFMSELTNPKLIYLSGLFHDIGKGRGGDHSEIGSVEARIFCTHHGLSEEETEIISWLVANHLLMSLTAQKRDTSDPQVIQSFAKLVKSPEKLKLLYLLTVADIRATSQSLWNSWKDSLLKELALATLALLKQDNKVNPESWKDSKNLVFQKLKEKLFQSSEIEQHLGHLSSDYFMKTPAETIIWQTENILQSKRLGINVNSPIVAVRRRRDGGGNEFFIYSRDMAELFAILTATFAQHHLNVLGATIYTDKNNFCHDSFFILSELGKPITLQQRKDEVIAAITNNIGRKSSSDIRIQRRMPRQFKHFDVDTKIVFSNDEFSQYTRLDVVARDRPGLLAMLAQALKDCEVRLHDARITTLGERVEDTFIISHLDNSTINDQTEQDSIAAAIKNQINKKH